MPCRVIHPARCSSASSEVDRDTIGDRVLEEAGVSLETIGLGPRIATELRADAADLLSGSHSEQIREVLGERGLVLFRRVNLDDRQQVAFARTFGDVLDQGADNIYKVTLDKRVTETADYLLGTFLWHIDGTTDEIPSRASVLSARRLSESGGQTEWANTYAAYEDLPQEEKDAIEGLRVEHSAETIERAARPDATDADVARWRTRPARRHPLVWTHASGRRSLVLGATASHVEGMDPEESRVLLHRLQAWATQPRFVYQHHWEVGDLVIWDNTGTMHRVVPYSADSGRLMHRTTLVGEEALA
jgi:alpha-ketoglutarate-dependent taurine dioxygenase